MYIMIQNKELDPDLNKNFLNLQAWLKDWLVVCSVVRDPERLQPVEAGGHPREADAEAHQVLPAPQGTHKLHSSVIFYL